ncbi:hypothetical protein STCU_01079 [Strigomonas culicis]|uniref:Uncharacterized protein n=1 Tax=Strigomonas culicis TaxID=28005 RepID=S9WID7_9TRYP|nr:hypothetical protein STCU_01079 [Strigomonas culicis]|eukprot:EPY35595.1 hypothetical protein STCU_01079 [Strigomonas culicis]
MPSPMYTYSCVSVCAYSILGAVPSFFLIQVHRLRRVKTVDQHHSLHLTQLRWTFLLQKLLLLICRQFGHGLEVILYMAHKVAAKVVVPKTSSRTDQFATELCEGGLRRISRHCRHT